MEDTRLKRPKHISEITWDNLPNKHSLKALHQLRIKESEAVADWFFKVRDKLVFLFLVSLLVFLISFKFITLPYMLYPFMLSAAILGSLFFIALYTGTNIIFSRFYKKF